MRLLEVPFNQANQVLCTIIVLQEHMIETTKQVKPPWP
jgi:hypothetical protein